MNSSIAWLDTSAEEQRRVREMIALFSQPESRDELGIGQIRDVFSNSLFPGTSVVQTRARYLLLVPWASLDAQRRGWKAGRARQHAEWAQRQLVETLRKTDDEGVIGRRTGGSVKTLPSSIYWGGLLTYGILRRDLAPEQLSGIVQRGDDADELVSRSFGDWHPTIPPVPDGFPNTLAGGLNLTAVEAEWLRERVMDSVPGTLLAHLVGGDSALDQASPAPWEDSACATAPQPVLELLGHAQRFSLVMNGASRLYNVLIAGKYEAAGFNTVEGSLERHRSGYQGWLTRVEEQSRAVQNWDLDSFWELVLTRNQRITFRTRSFVQEWIACLRDGSAQRALTDLGPRNLIEDRERTLKRGQSRLTNQKLLGMWNGSSGSGALDYRWPLVRRLVTDIHEGIGHA